jgi:hypothetical protein
MCERWWAITVQETGEQIGRVNPAWAPLLAPILRTNGLEVEMPAMLASGMARLKRRGGAFGWAWRALKWLLAVVVVALVLDVAADRTEGLPGQGAYSPAALAEMADREARLK